MEKFKSSKSLYKNMSSNKRAVLTIEGKAFIQLKKLKRKTNARTYVEVIRRSLDLYEKHLDQDLI